MEVPDTRRSDRIIELNGRGRDDPNALRTPAVLAAYLHAEHMKAFRQLLWWRLSVFGVLWAIVAIAFLSRVALWIGVALLTFFAAFAGIAEWRAHRQLGRLLGHIEPIDVNRFG